MKPEDNVVDSVVQVICMARMEATELGFLDRNSLLMRGQVPKLKHHLFQFIVISPQRNSPISEACGLYLIETQCKFVYDEIMDSRLL